MELFMLISKFVYLFIFVFAYSQLSKSIKPNKVFNQIVIINSTNFVVIQLKPNAQYQYVGSGGNGQVYQTSWVYSNYNYEPAKGQLIKPGEKLTDTKSRFVYKPSWYNLISQIDIVSWLSVNNENKTSIVHVHLLPKTKCIVSSNFLLGDESWIITGSNPLKPAKPVYHNYNRGFISGTENYIHVQSAGKLDKSIWYFKAPEQYYRDLSIGYAGTLEFELVWLAGNLAGLHINLQTVPVVKLSSPDLSVDYFLPKLLPKWTNIWTIQLIPENFQPKVSSNQFNKLLEQICSIEILGDWTSGYETIGLKLVRIKIQ